MSISYVCYFVKFKYPNFEDLKLQKIFYATLIHQYKKYFSQLMFTNQINTFTYCKKKIITKMNFHINTL